MISVLIPAYNEADRIAATIAGVRELVNIDEIIVIDDGSADGTAERAEAAGADIVLRQANAGKGAALQAGFAVAGGGILILLDADLAETAVEAGKLLQPILCGEADMTIANFTESSGRGGGMGLVVRLARWGIQRLAGRRMQTPLSGQRAIRREVLSCVGGFASGWGAEVALTILALRLNYRVKEVDTRMTHRVTGRSLASIRHRGAQFLAVGSVLLRLWRQRTPGDEMKSAPPDGKRGGRHG